jgi:hypothetical protein
VPIRFRGTADGHRVVAEPTEVTEGPDVDEPEIVEEEDE